MSHLHHHTKRGICMGCGCGEEGAVRGCDTILEDDSFISCLNKEARMQPNEVPVGNPPGSTHDSESQYTLAVRIGREHAGWEHANELEDERVAKDNHQHHLPEHCHNTFCLDCGKGGLPSPACIGCLRVIADAYRLTMEPDTSRYENPDYVGAFDIGRERMEVLQIDTPKDPEEKGPGFEARLKNMEGKAPMSLLSPIFIEGICTVLAHGSKKYAPNMWRDDPMSFTAELDSIFRHLFAFLRCEDYDAAPPSGSGLLHLFNAGCRLMFLTERYFTHPELDDRYPAPGLDDEIFQQEMHKGAEAQYEKDPIPGYQYYSRADLINELDQVWGDLKEERNV